MISFIIGMVTGIIIGSFIIIIYFGGQLNK